MIIDNDKTFRTKTGYCHILPDKIVFSKDGDIDKALTAKTDNKGAVRPKIILALLLTALLYFVYYQYQEEVITLNTLITLLILLPVVAFLISVSFKQNTVNYIDRDKIKRVKLYKSLGGMTYPKIFVYYQADNGKQLVKDISLQDPVLSGKQSLERILKMFTDENLISVKKQTSSTGS